MFVQVVGRDCKVGHVHFAESTLCPCTFFGVRMCPDFALVTFTLDYSVQPLRVHLPPFFSALVCWNLCCSHAFFRWSLTFFFASPVCSFPFVQFLVSEFCAASESLAPLSSDTQRGRALILMFVWWQKQLCHAFGYTTFPRSFQTLSEEPLHIVHIKDSAVKAVLSTTDSFIIAPSCSYREDCSSCSWRTVLTLLWLR